MRCSFNEPNMAINKLTKHTQLLKMNRIEGSPATMEEFIQNTVKSTQKERHFEKGTEGNSSER